MADYRALEEKLQQVLGGTRRPIAIAFVDSPPPGVAKFEGSEPSSCSFWRLAAAGRTFYTVPSDHQNCPVGGYTHNLLEPERMPELEQTLNLMSDIGYIRMEEVGGVFHLDQSAKCVVYSPLGEAPVPPSVVIMSGQPAKIMLLTEAATRAGEMSNLPLLGRPTCMAIPAAVANGAAASAGCIGNRSSVWPFASSEASSSLIRSPPVTGVVLRQTAEARASRLWLMSAVSPTATS